MSRERGQSLVWFTLVMGLVLVPLMALVADGARLFYVRGRVQAANDAACADAAWSAGDRRAFRDTGQTTFQPHWYVIGVAQSTFANFLAEQSAVGYTAHLVVTPDFPQALVHCQAQVRVPLLILPRQVTFTIFTTAGIRFR